jgi:hypothetical protein
MMRAGRVIQPRIGPDLPGPATASRHRAWCSLRFASRGLDMHYNTYNLADLR